MSTLRDRCDKFLGEEKGFPEFRKHLLNELEAFAREIRKEAFEDAAQIAGCSLEHCGCEHLILETVKNAAEQDNRP